LNYTKGYISIVFPGSNYNYFWFEQRKNKTFMGFRKKNTTKEKIIELLESNNIFYNEKQAFFSILIDKNFVEQKKDVFVKLAGIIKKNKD